MNAGQAQLRCIILIGRSQHLYGTDGGSKRIQLTAVTIGALMSHHLSVHRFVAVLPAEMLGTKSEPDVLSVDQSEGVWVYKMA